MLYIPWSWLKKKNKKKITGQGRAFLKYWFNWRVQALKWTKSQRKDLMIFHLFEPNDSISHRHFHTHHVVGGDLTFFFLWHGHFTSFLPQVLNIDKCMDVSLLNRKKNSKNKNIKPTVIQGRSYKNNYHFLHIYFKLWYLKYNYVYAYCTTGIIELYCIV